MKILVIEDDAETAAYIANGLKEHGHTVDLAATGRDGLFLAAGEGYDLMVVDRTSQSLWRTTSRVCAWWLRFRDPRCHDFAAGIFAFSSPRAQLLSFRIWRTRGRMISSSALASTGPMCL